MNIKIFSIFRFCLFETSCEQEDNFPSSLCIKVNGKICPLTVCVVLVWFVHFTVGTCSFTLTIKLHLNNGIVILSLHIYFLKVTLSLWDFDTESVKVLVDLLWEYCGAGMLD